MAKYEATFANFFPMPGSAESWRKVYEFDENSTEKQREKHVAEDMDKLFGDNAWTIEKIELIIK